MPRSPEPSRPVAPSRGGTRPAGPSRAVPLPRLRPVPPADPPYDDERETGHVPPPPTQGALALAYDRPWEAPARAEPSPRPADTPAQPAQPVQPADTLTRSADTPVQPADTLTRSADSPAGPAGTPARPGGRLPRLPVAPPPDLRELRGIGQAMAEILAGRRPPATVADRLTGRAYADLVRAGTMIRTRRPPLVALPHVKRPQDGAVEACLLVHCGERSHVLALRLERCGGKWLVTDFETA
ncbi:Rv3235 family protein [Sphaerisporangium sp. NPDC005289]|uniref:Rv3235 family protein n=1 Tax=Sphaerisporangium sp. NPDC005289 TaxID=3155247 RepID=UPI0033A61EBE